MPSKRSGPRAELPAAPVNDPEKSAAEVGLRYVTDEMPGFGRLRRGKGFTYVDAQGRPLRDAEHLGRIRSLAIPPAWSRVWICPLHQGHLQATGRDARGRKQYRYHPRWKEVRDANKFDRVTAFGRHLPRIRRRVERDLARRGLPREKVLATVVKLLETSLIRVGNPEYARSNESFGLTTLRDRHVAVRGSRMRFAFRGKSGVQQQVDVQDRRLAAIVQTCQDLPGQELFQYVDDQGSVRSITSSDVNDYLRAITGEEFTSKDFRTWSATVLAARELRELSFTTKAQGRSQVGQAIEAVAKRLGNTKTVCRSSYVHPSVVESFLDRTLSDALPGPKSNGTRPASSRPALDPEEIAVLAFLEGKLRRRSRPKPRKAPDLAAALKSSIVAARRRRAPRTPARAERRAA